MSVFGVLPGGYWDAAGQLHRDVELGALSGREEESLALAGPAGTPPARLVSELLSRCVRRLGGISPVPVEVTRRLLVADRAYLLLLVRQARVGELVRGSVACPWPDCGQRVGVQFALGEVPVEEPPHRAPLHTVRFPGVPELTFRLPDGTDEEERVLADPAALLARCVRGIGSAGVESLPPLARSALEERIQYLAPRVELTMEAACAECGRPFAAPFDLGGLLLGELRAERDLLYGEVHFLAYHYHWSEGEIMAMTREKRRAYIDVLAAALEGEEPAARPVGWNTPVAPWVGSAVPLAPADLAMPGSTADAVLSTVEGRPSNVEPGGTAMSTVDQVVMPGGAGGSVPVARRRAVVDSRTAAAPPPDQTTSRAMAAPPDPYPLTIPPAVPATHQPAAGTASTPPATRPAPGSPATSDSLPTAAILSVPPRPVVPSPAALSPPALSPPALSPAAASPAGPPLVAVAPAPGSSPAASGAAARPSGPPGAPTSAPPSSVAAAQPRAPRRPEPGAAHTSRPWPTGRLEHPPHAEELAAGRRTAPRPDPGDASTPPRAGATPAPRTSPAARGPGAEHGHPTPQQRPTPAFWERRYLGRQPIKGAAVSASTAIGMVSTSLRNLLVGEMRLTPQVDVTILAPDETGGNRRVNLFLYRIAENPYLRNEDFTVRAGAPDQLVPPPLSLSLFYLLTPYAPNDPQDGNATAHQILGEAMRVFYENPVVPPAHLDPGLADARERLQIANNALDPEELGRIWTTFSHPFRLSVLYQVSSVQLDQLSGPRPVPARVEQVGVPGVQVTRP